MYKRATIFSSLLTNSMVLHYTGDPLVHRSILFQIWSITVHVLLTKFIIQNQLSSFILRQQSFKFKKFNLTATIGVYFVN